MSSAASLKRKYGTTSFKSKKSKAFNRQSSRGVMSSAAVARRAVLRLAEKKGMDTILTLNPVISTTTTNASSFVLNLIQQGAGSWNRIGRKVNLQSARLRLSIAHTYNTVPATGVATGNQLRCVVVWDKQPSGGTIPTFDSIFGKTEQTGTESTTFLDPIRYDNMDRFAVLRDELVDANINSQVLGTTNTVTNFYSIDEFIKLGNREVVFSGQSSPMTIADVSTGALYIYFRAQVNVADNFMQLTDESFCRIRYVDM